MTTDWAGYSMGTVNGTVIGAYLQTSTSGMALLLLGTIRGRGLSTGTLAASRLSFASCHCLYLSSWLNVNRTVVCARVTYRDMKNTEGISEFIDIVRYKYSTRC